MLKTFPEIPYSSVDLIGTYGRAVEQWHDRNNVNVPLANTQTQRTDVYYRGAYTRICNPARKSYNWTWLDNLIISCIRNRQKFSFGLMSLYPEGTPEVGLARYTDGSFGSYPQWVHDKMQSEPVKDWKTGNTWVPNYNSRTYLDWLLEVHTDINTHLETTTYDGVKFIDAIYYIDVRGYGSWGEWHHAGVVDNMNEFPSGTRATAASLIEIINTHIKGFPRKPLCCLIATYDANWLNHTMNPPEVAYHALTAQNEWGLLGWRRDQWGATDNYIKDYLENNNRSYNGLVFKNAIMERYKFAPVIGEPPGWTQSYAGLESQIRKYHATSFGNGNYGSSIPSGAEADYIRAASKACGYRYRVSNMDYVMVSRQLTVKSNWLNEGIAPIYTDWDVEFRLTSGANTYVAGKSTMQLRGFLPTTSSKTVTDAITLPASIPNGTYKLSFIVKDRLNYMRPLPLAMSGRAVDSSYEIGEVVVGGVVIPNQPPIAFAGSDQLLENSVTSATLSATASDGDGAIIFGEWSVVKGGGVIVTKNAYKTVVNNIPEGENEYRWLVKDNGTPQLSAEDTVKVTRKAKPVEPPPADKKVKELTILYDNNTSEKVVSCP